MIELHGGTVEAQSDGPGQGSTFSLTLPLDTALKMPQLTEPASAGADTDVRRVLIIDDSPAVSRSLSMLLKASGHIVAVAADGPDGVEQARQLLPDVVLCDISMPGAMDGYAVARALRSDAATKTMFLVAVTGFGQDEDRRLALQAGFDRHLSKPVIDTVLDALLAEAGEKRSRQAPAAAE